MKWDMRSKEHPLSTLTTGLLCQLQKNPEHHGRIKHLDLQFYWLRDVVEAGMIQLVHIPSSEMAADFLTKALVPVKVNVGRGMVGMKG